jgi:hypothetical protein
MPNLFSDFPVEIFLWVLASTSGLIRMEIGACTPLDEATLPSPVGTPRSKPNRGYTIPNKPFILDPLL